MSIPYHTIPYFLKSHGTSKSVHLISSFMMVACKAKPCKYEMLCTPCLVPAVDLDCISITTMFVNTASRWLYAVHVCLWACAHSHKMVSFNKLNAPKMYRKHYDKTNGVDLYWISERSRQSWVSPENKKGWQDIIFLNICQHIIVIINILNSMVAARPTLSIELY